MATDPHHAFRDHLLYLLRGGGAHLAFDKAVDGIPSALRGAKVDPVPHTPWRLVEHMRIAQWDILEFCRTPGHDSPAWPAGYWPAGDAPPDAAAWDRAVRQFRADAAAVQALVADPAADLFAPLPNGTGQTLLREALLVADHNAY